MKNLTVFLTFTTLTLLVVDCYLMSRIWELDAQVTKLASSTNNKFENMVNRYKGWDVEITNLGDRVSTYTRNLAKTLEMHNDLKIQVDLLEKRELVVENNIRTIHSIQKDLLKDMVQGMRDSQKMEIEALLQMIEH